MVQIPRCGCLTSYKHKDTIFADLERKTFQGLFILKFAKRIENVQWLCAHKCANVQNKIAKCAQMCKSVKRYCCTFGDLL